MKQTQQKEYSRKAALYQQLALPITQNIEIAENEPVFVANAQLEELDYRELYSAYSEMIRKSQVEAMSRRSGFSAISGTAIPRPTRTRPLCT